MKIKNITLEYTTGNKEFIKPSDTAGFIIVDDVLPTADWNMNDVFQSMSKLLLSTMKATVNDYGTYKPLFDKLEETVGLVERQLSPAQHAKDFAVKFIQAYLYQEVFESNKHPELKKEAEKFAEEASAKLKGN